MDSYEISLWNHAFSFHMHTHESIPKKIFNLLLKDKFNGENEISASVHSFIF